MIHRVFVTLYGLRVEMNRPPPYVEGQFTHPRPTCLAVTTASSGTSKVGCAGWPALVVIGGELPFGGPKIYDHAQWSSRKSQSQMHFSSKMRNLEAACFGGKEKKIHLFLSSKTRSLQTSHP
uniref:4-hydroxyphenylpyruvate dioxygenase n=1 Tax=Lygus hesperus TaxID=30085 RepID=A0A0A9WSH9_LYGHE